jgi:hypothetical protein
MRARIFINRTGFTISWQPVLFEANYKHRFRRSQYDHLTDYYPPSDPVTGTYFPGDYAGNGYPAFIRERDVDQDEVEAKLALRPSRWLKATLKYQWRGTDYRTTTDPSTVTLFDLSLRAGHRSTARRRGPGRQLRFAYLQPERDLDSVETPVAGQTFLYRLADCFAVNGRGGLAPARRCLQRPHVRISS